VQIEASKSLTLPVSTSTKDPIDVLKLVVSKGAIFVEDKKVLDLKEGKMGLADIDPTDTQFIRALFTELDARAKQSRNIAQANDTVEFDGKVIMQADRSLPYELLKKIMYTSMMAGYADVKIAVMTKD
jgi:biopolymer transport protein TolR